MAASPEQTAANSAVSTAYGDAGATADNQKAALLQAIAQAGNAGKTAYQAQQAQTQQSRTGAIASLSAAQPAGSPGGPGGEFGAQLQQTVSGPGNVAAMVGAGTNPAGYYGGIGRASGDYMDAVKAAIPIQQAWTQRQANSIAATAQSEREAREAAIARDKAAVGRKVQAMGPDGKPLFAPDGSPIMVSEAEYASQAFNAAPTTGENSAAATKERAMRRVSMGSQLGEGSRAMQAIDAIIGDPHVTSYAQAMTALNQAQAAGLLPTTPGGKPLDMNALRGYMKSYWDGSPLPSSASLIAANPASKKRVAIITQKAGPLSGVANWLGGGPNTASNLRKSVGGLIGLG